MTEPSTCPPIARKDCPGDRSSNGKLSHCSRGGTIPVIGRLKAIKQAWHRVCGRPPDRSVIVVLSGLLRLWRQGVHGRCSVWCRCSFQRGASDPGHSSACAQGPEYPAQFALHASSQSCSRLTRPAPDCV